MILAPGVNPPPEDRLRDTIAMWLWVLGMCVGGTVHAFFLRKEVFLPKVKSPETTGSAPASDPWATATRTRSPSGLGRIGAYTLLEKISQGGQGVVYLGRAPDGRQVAVKAERFHGGDRERLLFMREVDAARRVPPFSTAPPFSTWASRATPRSSSASTCPAGRCSNAYATTARSTAAG
ncbi:hypothetical protein [Nonomuraea salmonea]|uniref:hypothetical protein n=1 Tax=Nonomuraea salmonea TaxID=46181 RepID=UPI0031EC13A6